MRQDLQRHIFESAGGAVPQLQDVGSLGQPHKRGDLWGTEFSGGIGAVNAVGQIDRRVITEKIL